MAGLKIFSLIVLVVIIQTSLAKPLDTPNSSSSEEDDLNISAPEALALNIFLNLMMIGKNSTAKALKVSQDILKDETLIAHKNPHVLEFKKNLTQFVQKYEADKKSEHLDIFTNTTKFYFEIPKDQLTEEQSFIVDLLKKYKVPDMDTEIEKEFKVFMDDIKNSFEAYRKDFQPPMLEWFKNFKTLNNVDDQIKGIEKYFDLFTSKKM